MIHSGSFEVKQSSFGAGVLSIRVLPVYSVVLETATLRPHPNPQLMLDYMRYT